MSGWIGVDLDSTLAYYEFGMASRLLIGNPIPLMLARVKEWLSEGMTVKLFTARACDPDQIEPIREWLNKHGLEQMEITNVKDYSCIEIWDDRAIQIIANTGRRADGFP
jgi:hypothetical protein